MKNKDKQRLESLFSLGCIVCLNQGFGYSEPEIHHLRHGMGMGQKNDAFHTIPLCPKHHRTGNYGVALHAGQHFFETKFGSELELLDKTNRQLETQRISKIFGAG